MAWLNALWGLVVHYWPAVLAVVLPFVVARIARSSWSGGAKTWTAFALSVLVGVVGTLVAGIPLTPETLGLFAAAVFTGSSLAYTLFRRAKMTNAWLEMLLAMGSQPTRARK